MGRAVMSASPVSHTSPVASTSSPVMSRPRMEPATCRPDSKMRCSSSRRTALPRGTPEGSVIMICTAWICGCASRNAASSGICAIRTPCVTGSSPVSRRKSCSACNRRSACAVVVTGEHNIMLWNGVSKMPRFSRNRWMPCSRSGQASSSDSAPVRGGLPKPNSSRAPTRDTCQGSSREANSRPRPSER